MGKNCSLAPGFRFHPTDEELVWYYLRRKVTGKSFRVDAISEIDIYKVEPNDLPGLSKLKTRDLEWYFFSGLDRKYGNGSRTNRATNEGYWKTTGKDRPVYHKSQVVGMKKTLVYHKGRAPRGERSNWVMHEYKLSDDVFGKSALQDGFVLCRVFQKSGTGPKNGEQYGAPLVEEEWEDDEHLGVVEPTEVSFEDPYVDDNSYLEQIDLDQAIDFQVPENVPFPYPVSSSNFGDIQDMTGTDQNCTVDESEDKFCLDDLVGQKLPEVVEDQNNAYVVKNEYMIQPNDRKSEAALDLPDELFSDNPPMDGNDIFFDISNFPDPVQDEVDFGFFESCLDDLNFELPDLANQRLTDDDINANWQEPDAREQLHGAGDDNISSSLHVTEYSKAEPSKNDQHSWLSLLENIPAPPAFASEYPSKDVAARLSAAVQSSNSVTTGIIRIRDMPVGVNGSGIQWSFDKAGNINVRLSFDIPEVVSLSPVGLESLTGLLSNKISSATSRGWLWFIFFLVFAFGLSVKIGTCIFAK